MADLLTRFAGVSGAGVSLVVLDDFEDGNITEYSGDTDRFQALAVAAYEGAYGLRYNYADSGGGIYRLTPAVSQGNTYKWWLKVYNDPIDWCEHALFRFGVQDGTHYYAAGFDVDCTTLRLLKLDPGLTVLGSVAIAPVRDTWYQLTLAWAAGGGMTLSWSGGAQQATGSDNTYATGGFGFEGWNDTPSTSDYVVVYWDYAIKP